MCFWNKQTGTLWVPVTLLAIGFIFSEFWNLNLTQIELPFISWTIWVSLLQNANILKLFQDRTLDVWNAWYVFLWGWRVQYCSCSTLCHCLVFGLVFSAGSIVWPFPDCVDVLAADKACIQAQLVEEQERKAAEMNTSVAVVQWVL